MHKETIDNSPHKPLSILLLMLLRNLFTILFPARHYRISYGHLLILVKKIVRFVCFRQNTSALDLLQENHSVANQRHPERHHSLENGTLDESKFSLVAVEMA